VTAVPPRKARRDMRLRGIGVAFVVVDPT